MIPIDNPTHPRQDCIHNAGVRYDAAIRDEIRFSNADAFDIERSNKVAHLAFGSGVHCHIGLELARVEMAAAFKALTQRFSSIVLVDEDQAEEIWNG